MWETGGRNKERNPAGHDYKLFNRSATPSGVPRRAPASWPGSSSPPSHRPSLAFPLLRRHPALSHPPPHLSLSLSPPSPSPVFFYARPCLGLSSPPPFFPSSPYSLLHSFRAHESLS